MEKVTAGVTTLPPHNWTKGRDDTRGLYTSPENTGGTAGDGRRTEQRSAPAPISTALQGWAPAVTELPGCGAPATPSVWGSQQRPVR